MNESNRPAGLSVQQHASGTGNNAPPAQTTRSHPEASQTKVQQPKPQALPSRSGPSSILVSPRQKGNPILNGVRNVAWEYSDTVTDYVLGATTCVLFLSLKYHRLHPKYICNRIRDLSGQFGLRILLTMVEIENYEESLRELSKTSDTIDCILRLTVMSRGKNVGTESTISSQSQMSQPFLHILK